MPPAADRKRRNANVAPSQTLNSVVPPFNVLLFPSSLSCLPMDWTLDDSICLRNTCKQFRAGVRTSSFLACYMNAMEHNTGVDVALNDRQLHSFASVMFARRKLVYFLPRVVHLARCECARLVKTYLGQQWNSLSVAERSQLQAWVDDLAPSRETSDAIVAGSFALRQAEKQLDAKHNNVGKMRAWKYSDLDAFVPYGDSPEEKFVWNRAVEFCSACMLEAYGGVSNQPVEILKMSNTVEYPFYMNVSSSMDDDLGGEAPFPDAKIAAFPENVADKLILDPELRSLERRPANTFASNCGTTYAASDVLKGKASAEATGLKFPRLDRVVEKTDFFDKNRVLGLPRTYEITMAMKLSYHLQNCKQPTFSYVGSKINLIQYKGKALAPRALVSGFDILPCQVWLSVQDDDPSFHCGYGDGAQSSIVDRKLVLTKYAFPPLLPGRKLFWDEHDDEYGDDGPNRRATPIQMQESRILKYLARGYSM